MSDILFVINLSCLMAIVFASIWFFIKLQIIVAETNRYKTLFRNFPTPKLQIDKNGYIEDATLSAVKLFNYNDASSLIGTNISEFFLNFHFHENDEDSYLERDTVQVCRVGDCQKIYNIRIHMFLKDKYILVIHDLTSHHANENKINALMVALQASHDGIALMDREGNIIYANSALWSIYDIQNNMRENFFGQHWTNIYNLKGQSIIKENILPILDERKVWSGAEWIKSITGRKFYADLSLAQTSMGYMGIVRDRTEFIEEQTRHQTAQKHLQGAQRNNAIARIIRGMVHDFNNTLSVIMGHSDLLLESKSLRDVEKESLDYIVRATHKSRDMLSQIRSLILKDKDQNCLPRKIDIVKSIECVLSMYESVDYKTNLLSLAIPVDDEKLQTVCHHLIRNALDAAAGDRAKIFVSFKKMTPPYFVNEMDGFTVKSVGQGVSEINYGSIDADKNYIEFQVRDQGDGIDPDILPHIIEPFFTTKGRGYSGLGLSIVASFLKECHGAIRIHTKQHGGTSVSIYLPVDAATPIWLE